MTYQVLARKWRPQDFSSVIGQEPIITALKNGLKENRIAQAYLFSGIRGVGKTTAARVLAKALNCERGAEPGSPAADPCNECPPCREITEGNDLDFLEVDAATYSKVEQVRELTESLRYGPARDRYKVVVLDEVHRLSRQAFDALLKIVEEPPPHLVFIFATTEIDAVPATILSRCQEFQFRRVPSTVLAKHLRRISEAEKIQVSDAALRLIARAGEGSVRDSVALLDQLATFGSGEISDHYAADLLGGLDAAIFNKLLAAILEGEPAAILEIVREIEANGWDPHNVYGQFLLYTRDALHLAMGGSPDSLDLPLEEAESLADLMRPYSYENTLRLAQHLLASEPTVRRSEFALLALQLAWLRAAELPKLTQIEDLLSGRKPMSVPPGKPPDSLLEPSSDGPDSPAPNRLPVVERAVEKPESPSPESSVQTGGDPIASFRQLLSSRRQPLAALFESAKLAFEEGHLQIQPPAGDALLAAALKREGNAALLDELLREIWGEGTTWKLRAPIETRNAAPDGPGATGNGLQEVREDPMVQAVLDIFGGNVQSVQ